MNGTTNSIQVFVTHKSEDIGIVRQFITILETYDPAERLSFILAENMPVGVDWREFIHENVLNANVLFF